MQGCGNFGGVVRIIIPKKDPARRSKRLQAAAQTAKLRKHVGQIANLPCFRQFWQVGNLPQEGGSRQGIENVVPAKYGKLDPAEVPAAVDEVEAVSPTLAPHIGSHPVRRFLRSKSLDPAAGSSTGTTDGRIAQGHKQAAIGRQQGGKTGECRFEGLAGVVAIEMIGLDIQDHRVVRAEMQEILAKFAGLDKDGLSVAGTATVASTSRHRAINDRGIAARGHEDFRRHGRDSRLSMGPGHGQAAVPLHQPAEHFGIAQDGDAELGCSTKFGIGGRNGTAVDQELDVLAHLVRRMSRKAADTRLREGIVPGDCQVRAAQPPALSQQDLRQGPHAGTPDTNQMGPPRSGTFKY